MSPGEQASPAGVPAMVKPATAVEIGTYTGASLARIAAMSGCVHTFDLVGHVDSHPSNVRYHLGDSAVTVPRVLADGDHSRAGAYRDACNVFDSPATKDAVILFHDIANEAVRGAVRDAIAGRARRRHEPLRRTAARGYSVFRVKDPDRQEPWP